MTHTTHTHAFHTNVGAVPATELARRRDLRQTRHIVSIDPPGCQDIDDALSVHLLANGNYEIGVHIADVTGRKCTADFSVVGITFLFCQGLLFFVLPGIIFIFCQVFVRVYYFLLFARYTNVTDVPPLLSVEQLLSGKAPCWTSKRCTVGQRCI